MKSSNIARLIELNGTIIGYICKEKKLHDNVFYHYFNIDRADHEPEILTITLNHIKRNQVYWKLI